MGNTLLSNNSFLKQTAKSGENTYLANYIKDWALNDYNIEPSLDMNKPINQQQLKKRACCVGQTNIPIGLPGVDDTGKFIPVIPVRIPIFNNQNEINANNCNLPYESDGGRSSYLFALNKDKSDPTSATDACQAFYPEFCRKVMKNRTNYNDAASQYYGSITIDAPDGSTDPPLFNPYYDCNCENSFLKQPKFAQFVPGGQGIDADTKAQSVDTRCRADGTWKRKNKAMEQLCLNNINVINSNISASDQAGLNLNQTCGGGESLNETKARIAKEKADAEAAEAKRLADEKEAKRLADEKEAKRIADEKEAKRLAEEKEAKRLADEKAAQEKAEAEKRDAAEKAAAQAAAEKAEAERLAYIKQEADIESQKNMIVIGGVVGGVLLITGILYFTLSSSSGSSTDEE